MSGPETKLALKRKVMTPVEIILAFVCVGLLGWILGPHIIGPFYIRHRFTPREKATTIEQLENDFGVKLETRRVTVQGIEYTFATGPLVKWAVPSGPPMYIFDSQGHLIDYTLEAYYFEKFRRKWLETNSTPVLPSTATP